MKDYKFYTFNGIVKLIQVDIDRFGSHKRQYYSREWEFIDLKCDYPNSPETIIKKPKKLDEMIKASEKLSYEISHLRVDYYIINDEPIFGEITFHHSGGDGIFDPIEYDLILGTWINLPNIERKKSKRY